MGSKMVEFSILPRKMKFAWPFQRGFQKYNFFQGGPNFGGGMAGKCREMGNNRDIYYYANQRAVNLERQYWPLSPGIKVLMVPQFSYMPDEILGKKMKKLNLTFLGHSPPKI